MTALLIASDNATGASTRIELVKRDNFFDRVVLYKGTFGGGTLDIEASEDGVLFFSILSVTAPGNSKIFARFPFIRAVLAGATGGSVDVVYID